MSVNNQSVETDRKSYSFEHFRSVNRVQVNRTFNRVLWFCVLAGPALALGICFGLFKEITYSMCLVVSFGMACVAGFHYFILKKWPSDIGAGIFALIGMDILIAYMNYAHVAVRITWFIVPLMSLLFTDRRVYLGMSLFNYAVMVISLRMTAAYQSGLRIDFLTPAAGFYNQLAGLTIEYIIICLAGYVLGKMTAGYFRRMLDEQQRTGEREEKLEEQLAILDSMANIYDYVNLISFIEMSEMSLRDETRLKRYIGEQQDHTYITTGMKKNIIPDMTDDFWEFTNIRTVPQRMIGKRSISAEFIDRQNGWFRAQYIRISSEIEREPDIVIFTVQNIAAEKRREQNLIRISLTDELTGLYNRRSYDEDILSAKKTELSDDYTLMSVDINGLKKVNDNLGHAAGDELIKGAADCLSAALYRYGKVYRTGGDEFFAIVKTDNPQKLRHRINDKADKWQGVFVKELRMSVGYASHGEFPQATIEELEKIADERMYQEKAHYYEEPGHDRRSS